MEEIDLKELLLVYWKKKWFVAIVTLISIAIGYVYSYYHVVPKYEATTTLMLGRISNFSSESTESRDDYQIAQSEITINSSLVSTYSKLITSRTLVQKVIANLNLGLSEGAIIGSTTVSRVEQTQLIQIKVRNTNGELASKIANEIAKVFSEQIEDIYNINNVYIVDKAIPSGSPYNINHTKDLGISALIGFVLSSGLVLLYYLLDNTIKSEEQLEENVGVKNLINIPLEKKRKNKISSEIIAYSDPKSIISESFRTLRTNVQFSNANAKDAKTFLISSCFQSEGKSYVSANLAITFAQVGKKVILVDADMRKGRQAKIFNLVPNKGLSNYISNLDENGIELNEDLGKFINETDIPNLSVITSGTIPPNPSELLASPKLEVMIEELKKYYDIIIFDGAPIVPITDSLILARLLGSTIIVTLYNKTKKDDLKKVKNGIEAVGGKILGTCINCVPINSSKRNSKYYYYNNEKNKTNKVKKIKNFFQIIINKINMNLKKIKIFFKNILKKKEIARLPEASNFLEIKAKESKTLEKEQKQVKKSNIAEQKNNIKFNKNINENEKINQDLKQNLEPNAKIIENLENTAKEKNIEQEKIEKENLKKQKESEKLKIAQEKEKERNKKNQLKQKELEEKEKIKQLMKEGKAKEQEENRKIRAEKIAENKEKIEQFKNSSKEKFYELKEKIIQKYNNEKEKYSKLLEERAIKRAEELEVRNKIQEEKRIEREKLEKIKLEEMQKEKEKREIELEKIRKEKEEQRKLKEIELAKLREEKEEQKRLREIEQEKLREEREEQKKLKELELEKIRLQKEEEKNKEREEAKMTDEYIEENLYPKTKNTKLY